MHEAGRDLGESADGGEGSSSPLSYRGLRVRQAPSASPLLPLLRLLALVAGDLRISTNTAMGW